ncbi:MAG: LON peptidase substrate-binding domain-containing protein [Rubrivivax sp.]
MNLPDPLPLFPLQTVLFPGGLLPLKVFEARYLDLMGHCMRSGEPFGVVCMSRGAEAGDNPEGVRIERVGVLARIEDVDAEQAGILKVRCIGGSRFRLREAPAQQAQGLWVAPAELIDADAPRLPDPALQPTVQALQQALEALLGQDVKPFAEPLQWRDAGWVANRWCELLPIPLAAKQRLMELEDPTIRLQLVDEFLRSRQVFGRT